MAAIAEAAASMLGKQSGHTDTPLFREDCRTYNDRVLEVDVVARDLQQP